MKIIILLLGLTPLLAAPVMADDSAAVRELTEATINDVTALLRDRNIDQAERDALILDIIDPVFDFRRMAMLSLGKQGWMMCSEQERRDFVDLFVARLQESYLEKLNLYTDQAVVVEAARQVQDNRIEVRTLLVSGDDEKEMLYKFYRDGTAWLVYDVAILGVSIVQTYRSQFREVLGSGGSAELLAQLRDHGRFSVPD